MAETSSRDFVDWQKFKLIDMNTASREDYYLMAIAAEIRRGNVKNAKGVKLADFVLPFTEGKPKATKKLPTKEEIKARTQRSKNAWFALAGVKPPKE